MRRRGFLKGIGVAAAGLAASGAAGANERFTVGIVGCSRGAHVGKSFAELGARIAYVCDTDEGRLRKAQENLGADQGVSDFRRILDDPSVDAVVLAPPDHWHAPAAILACEAGKHVYVEKPCSHNIREGRLMIETARRTKRVVQVGSQSRGTATLQRGIAQVREGAIGDVLMAKAWNSQRRANIGHCESSDPPAGFDYDLWVGPAPMRPYQENCHHYSWHWWYDFGTGDAGNDGVHELDIAVWGLGVDTHPSRVTGYGAKMHFDDDQQFPDTQYVTFEYPGGDGNKVLIYEHRIWSPYVQEGHENATVFYGTEGYLVLAKGWGWQLFGPQNNLIREEQGSFSVPEHARDFMDAVKNDTSPAADTEIGHHSATLAHLANIIARTGQGCLTFDPASERFVDNDAANALVARAYRDGHWAVPAGV